MKIFTWALSVLFAFSFISDVDCQTSHRYLVGGFDTTVNTLPVDFRGHEFAFLRTVLSKDKPDFKDEFDTTEIYQQKLATGRALSRESQFALFLDQVGWGGAKFEYNADRQIVTFTFKLEKLTQFMYSGKELSVLDMKATSWTDKASGRLLWKAESLAITNPEMVHIFTFPATAEKARSIKSSHILVLFHVKEPFFYSLWPQKDAGIFRDALVVRIDDFWIVDSKTGEIYAKLRSKANV